MRALEDISSKFLTDEEQQTQASEIANREMRSSLKSQASSELEKMKKGDYDDLMQKQAAGKHEVDEIMNQAASQNNDGLFAQA
jgi:hypothetical protein